MIIHAGLLVAPAESAGIRIPPDPEKFADFMDEYPHFGVFALCQIGTPVRFPSDIAHNAEIVASIPENRIRRITWKQMKRLGFHF